MSTEIHGHYYCAKCDKRIDVNLLNAGQYRIKKHLYCAKCYEEETKNERGLKPLFCAFCKKQIADHHIHEEFTENWYIYRLHCTICGHDSYVSCAEAEK